MAGTLYLTVRGGAFVMGWTCRYRLVALFLAPTCEFGSS